MISQYGKLFFLFSDVGVFPEKGLHTEVGDGNEGKNENQIKRLAGEIAAVVKERLI